MSQSLYTTDRRRLAKAHAIVASRNIERIDPQTWHVTSQTQSGHHVVFQSQPSSSVHDLHCSCADWMGRNHPEIGLVAPCKHGLAVGLSEGWVDPSLDQGEDEGGCETATVEVTTPLQADGVLWELGCIETELQQIQAMADEATQRIAQWRASEHDRLQRRIDFWSQVQAAFLQRQGCRTLRLPHGQLRLRRQPDRITVEDASALTPSFLRTVPAKQLPDLKKIRAHVGATGQVPPGVRVESQPDKLSFTTVPSAEGRFAPAIRALWGPLDAGTDPLGINRSSQQNTGGVYDDH